MECWVLYRKKDVEKNNAYIEMYKREALSHNMRMKLIILEDTEIIICNGRHYVRENGAVLPFPDIAVNRSRDYKIAEILENEGVMVFNSSKVTRIANDKMLTLSVMAQNSVPVCDTALNSPICFPCVVKSLDGHGGSEVYLAENEYEYKNAVSKISGDFITQKVVSDKGKDLRVYVVGNKIIAAMLRYNPNDFRSNYSLGGIAKPYTLSQEETDIVNNIIKIFNFGMAGIDFIFDCGKMILNEIEDAAGARMLYANTNIDIANLYFDHIEKTFRTSLKIH